MKDSKSLLLLVVSILLILVSFALLWTWGYQFNSLTKDKQGTVYILKDSTTAANATRDSLKKLYASTVKSFSTLDSTWTKADSLKGNLEIQLSEFYKLRNEIGDLLKNPGNKSDLDNAKQKIGQLQKKVEDLNNTNTDVEKENRRLYAVLQQLTNNSREAVQNAIKPVVYENKAPGEKASIPASLFSSSDLRLAALMVEDDKEQETYQALQTDKFTGSFTVKNNATQFSNTEVIVVVLQPNGKVLQNSSWDSGTFETADGGKKIYSCKLKFDYNKGEQKRLSFSLNGNRFDKGNYAMQIYYNGVMIGKISKTLI